MRQVRPVKVGPADGENAAIESGLVSGELAVVDGADKLREGAKVELVTRDGATDQKKGPRPPGGGPRRKRSGQ
jgi:multidrug efflux system membrane fusion protein